MFLFPNDLIKTVRKTVCKAKGVTLRDHMRTQVNAAGSRDLQHSTDESLESVQGCGRAEAQTWAAGPVASFPETCLSGALLARPPEGPHSRSPHYRE